MLKYKFTHLLKYLLVIGLGLLTFWKFTFFRPFSTNYPPGVAYQVVHTQNSRPDTILAAPGAHYAQNPFGEFFLGKHYRFLWETPVKAPVLNLETEAGGLRITKRGGGMQTTSFTLVDTQNVPYSLRSVDKDPISVIPPVIWPTVLGSFIRDQISATDPYALRPVLSLTAAAGIAHTEAKLVFVRNDDPAFKPYNLPGNGFFYLSRKTEIATPEFPETPPGRIYATNAMLQTLARNPRAKVDTLAFLKCRLFDLYIGDWDRHAGQWDWLGFLAGNDTVFRPVPKDRDQAFGYYSDGVFPYLLSRDFAVRKITTFKPEYDDLEGFAQNGSDLDNRFLRTVPEKEFIRLAEKLQQDLNPEALQKAVSLYQKPVQQFAYQTILPTLKARKKLLKEAAVQYAVIIKTRTI